METLLKDHLPTVWKSLLATKEDVMGLQNSAYADLKGLRRQIKAQTSEMIKWMFIFWIGQVGATLAIVFLFLKK